MSENLALPGDEIRCVLLLSASDPADREAVQAAWLKDDFGLALASGAVRRYVRTIPLPSDQRGFNPRGCYGVAQFWGSGVDAAADLCRRYVAELRAQGGPLGASEVQVVPTRERVIIDGPERPGGGQGVKAFYFARRRPGMTVAEFQDHWLNVHGPLVIGTPGVGRYVQCHPCPELYDLLQVPYDSLAEITYADEAGVAAFGGPSPERDAQSLDLPNLFDLTSKTPRFYVEDVSERVSASTDLGGA